MKEFDIRDFGAVGDGETLNTAAIQAAIDACAKAGGGRVCVSGGTYITGTIFMRSFTELSVEANAVLKASSNTDDFPDFETDWNSKAAPRATAKCLIYFGNIKNASLTGLGTIDCSGSAFCDPEYDPSGKLIRYVRNTLLVPARMVFIMGCTNIKVEDITMTEMAGGWGYWVNNSQYVTFKCAKLYCNPHYPNADGIHINCSSDVLVEGCIIHSGDDSIIIRSNTNTLSEKRVCERIIVRGCTLSSKFQAVRIAWRNDYCIKNCILSDLVITNSGTGIAVELPDHSSPTDFGNNPTVVENIQFNNIVFDQVLKNPIRVIVHPENLYGKISGLRFSNITSNSLDYPLVVGRKDAILEDIYFDNCKFTVEGERNAPCFKNVKGLHINNTTFDLTDEKGEMEYYTEEH